MIVLTLPIVFWIQRLKEADLHNRDVSAKPGDFDYSDPDIYIIRGSGPEDIAAGTTDVVQNAEPVFRTPPLRADETYIAFLEEWRYQDRNAATTFPQRVCFDVSLTPTP